MERRKTPVHDFAPSWLKINSFDKDSSSTSIKKTDREDTFDLRPQYLKQRDTNKDPNTSTSSSSSSSSNHLNQKPINQLASSLLNTSFDYDSDRIGEDSSRQKGWPSNSSSNQSNGWSNNRRYNLNSKPPSNPVTSSESTGDSTRRLFNNSRINDIGIVNLPSATKSTTTGYPHLHQNQTHFHQHGNIKGRLSNSVKDDSPLVSGDLLGGNNNKSKSNTRNGFADSNKFKEEFPSLVDEKQVSIETNNGNNVWDNVANKVFRSGSSKVSLVSRHLGSSLYGDKGEKSMNGSSYFRALVPVVPRRKTVNSINGNGSGSKESSTLVNSLSNLSLGSTTKILPVFSKPTNHSSVSHSSASHSSTSHSMAILAKKNPKMKNSMMDSKARSSSNDSRPETNDEQKSIDPFDDDDDGINSCCLKESNNKDPGDENKFNLEGGDGEREEKINKSEDNDVHLLSSSLEAEERLLREMGWKEEDEDENFYAPLTEDEVKEFKDLINKRKSLKRYTSPKIHPGRFKFQVNSNQLPLSQLNFLNTLATEDQNNDNSDTSSDEDDDDNGRVISR